MGHYNDDGLSSEVSTLTNEPHVPLGHALLQNASLLRELGLRDPVAQHLGTGAFGAAFEIPWTAPAGAARRVVDESRGRSVLKLTRDPTEVEASALLVGQKTERIVPVYGVWYLRNTYQPGLRRWYVVHRGYLHPLTTSDKELVELLFSLYDDVKLDLVIPKGPKQHATIGKWRGYVRDHLMGGAVTSDDEGGVGALGVGKAVKRCMQLLLQVGAAVDEMHRVGIDWEDFHSDNVMRNEAGRLVIADVGWGLLHNDFEAEIQALDDRRVAGYGRALAAAGLQ